MKRVPSPHVRRCAGLDALVSALGGRFQRAQRDADEHAGGAPRGWRAARGLELAVVGDDADAGEAARWAVAPSPRLPRMRRRARRARGGAVAIVRDISASMWGLHAKWASSVILRLVDTVARRAKMRVAYFEFNESCFRLSTARADGPSDDRSAKAGLGERATARRVDAADEGFAAAPESAKEALRRRRDAARAFGRNHDAVCDHASNLWCDGLTNYQVALADVLGAYEAASRLGLSGGKHVLMLTDGCPTKGCESLSAERRRARQLGVEIQCVAPKGNAPQDITRYARLVSRVRLLRSTIYIGDGDYPGVLSALATETGGARFQAIPHARKKGCVRLVDFGRDRRAATRAADHRAEEASLQQRNLLAAAHFGLNGDSITLPR